MKMEIQNYKLVCLAPALEISLALPGKPFQVAEMGVTFTLNEDGSHSLIEVTKPALQIKVGSQTVIDVGIVKVGQMFEIDSKPFVFLKDKSVFLNAYAEDCSVHLPFHKVEKEANVVKISHISKVSFGLLFLVSTAAGIYQLETLIRGRPIIAAQSSQAPEAFAEAKDIKSLPEETEVAQTPQSEVVAKPAQVSQTTPKASPKITNAPVSPEVLKAQRQKFEELLLESRFDPEAARRKMRALAQDVPRGSDLSKRIHHHLGSTH